MSSLLTQCPSGTVQTGTEKVDPARKFKCTTAARGVVPPLLDQRQIKKSSWKSNQRSWKVIFQIYRAQNLICSLLYKHIFTFLYWYFGTILFIICLQQNLISFFNPLPFKLYCGYKGDEICFGNLRMSSFRMTNDHYSIFTNHFCLKRAWKKIYFKRLCPKYWLIYKENFAFWFRWLNPRFK